MSPMEGMHRWRREILCTQRFGGSSIGSVSMLGTKDAGMGSKAWRNELGPGHVRPPEPSGV